MSKSEELAKTLSIATDELAKDREQLKGIDSVITEIDDGLTGRRNENRSFDQELTKLEIRLAEERSQLGFIQSNAQDEYQTDPQKSIGRPSFGRATSSSRSASISTIWMTPISSVSYTHLRAHET